MKLNKKRFLITGAAGTVGFAITKRLLKLGATVCAFDNSENDLFNLNKSLSKINKNLRIFLGDIRNLDRLNKASTGVDYTIHCAALKHVEISEYNSFETILTNIIGVQNIIESAITNNVKKVLFTSSDKSVNPSSFMGTTKLLGEKLITAANKHKGKKQTIFSSVRFGNVLNSNGSIFKIFKNQIDKNLPLNVTSEKMSRYFLSIEQAVELCFFSLKEMIGGEIFIPKMQSFDIVTLARVMGGKNYPINYIKPKIGEKFYEELITESEIDRTIILKSHFVIIPELNKEMINDSKLLKKVYKKYSNYKRLNRILRSDLDKSSVESLKQLLKNFKLI